MVKINNVIGLASLFVAVHAHAQYEREVDDYEQEAREFDEYSDVLEREPEPLFGALAGIGAGGSLAGGLLSAIGNVVPGKAGEGLRGAGQVIAGVGQSIAGRSEIPDEFDEYAARNFDDDLEEREFLDFDDLDERDPGWESDLDELD